MKKNEISIKTLILNNQRKTTLIPISIITSIVFLSLLLLLFLFINKHEKIFLKEAEKNIINITKKSSIILNNHLTNISKLNQLLANSHQNLLDTKYKQIEIEEKLITSNNGVLIKPVNDGGSSLYCSVEAKKHQTEIEMIKLTANIDYIYKSIVNGNDTITTSYYNSTKGILRVYPFIADLDEKLGATLNLEGVTLFPKRKRAKGNLWSDVYLNPIGDEWMISCISPVYRGDTLEGITGVDIKIDNISKKLLDQWTFKDSDSFIIDKLGRLISAQKEIQGKLKLKKLINRLKIDTSKPFKPTSINLLNLENKTHVEIFNKMLANNELSSYIDIDGKSYFLTQYEISETGWKLFSITEKDKMVKSLLNQSTVIKRIYYSIFTSIFIFTLFAILFLIKQSKNLSNQIASPIDNLTNAVKKASQGKFKINQSNIIEINSLAMDFNNLIVELNASHKQLEDFNNVLQIQFEQEVEKNREQERLVFQQARLLQMGELIGNIAHQWRQPLNGIALIIQSLHISSQDETLTDTFLEEQCHIAMEIINKMSGTIDNFRDFFKTDEKVSRFNINKQIKETLKIVSSSFEDRRILLFEEYETKLNAYTNKQIFSQIILSIISNAEHILLERKIENKIIFIKTHDLNNKIIVEIKDSGGGIDSSILPKIFDPYFSTKKQNQGTGLGLYMTKILVSDNLKGILSVKNENFSIKNNTYYGACFKIVLPAFELENNMLEK